MPDIDKEAQRESLVPGGDDAHDSCLGSRSPPQWPPSQQQAAVVRKRRANV